MSQIPEGYSKVANSDKSAAMGASRVGPADPKEVLTVSIRVRKPAGAPAIDLNALTAAPRGQRQHLSREEYAQRYGAAQADVDQITAFAKANNLKVVEISLPRRTVVLSGTVEQM